MTLAIAGVAEHHPDAIVRNQDDDSLNSGGFGSCHSRITPAPARLGRPAKYLLALQGTAFTMKWAGIGDVNFGLFTLVWDHLMGTYSYDHPPARLHSARHGRHTQQSHRLPRPTALPVQPSRPPPARTDAIRPRVRRPRKRIGEVDGVGGSGECKEELLEFGFGHRLGALGAVTGDAFAQAGRDDLESRPVEGS